MPAPKDPTASFISRPKRAKRGAAPADAAPAVPPLMVGANVAEAPGPDAPPVFKEALPLAPPPTPKPFSERAVASLRNPRRVPLPVADRYLVRSPAEKLVVVRPGTSTWIHAGKVLDIRHYGSATIQMIYQQGVDLEPLPPDWKPPKRR